MSNYYQKRDAKVNISHQLMKSGWKVYGYKANESDSMTDYYSPANWDGIATKNGYVLVVDNANNSSSGKPIRQYNSAGSASSEDRAKLAKLAEMREDRGATPEEADTARILADKLRAKVSDAPTYTTIDYYPVFMSNPGRSMWHIEKDGKIYDKGAALTKFAKLPSVYMFDLETETFKDEYAYRSPWGTNERIKRELTEDEAKAVSDFKTLLQRLDNIASGVAPMGDGTEETEEEGLQAEARQGYEKVTITESKTVTKPIKVDRQTIQEGDVLNFSYHGGYWLVIQAWEQKGVKHITYEILGSEKRGYQRTKNAKRYYQPEPRIIKDLLAGKVSIHTMQTVTETFEVDKWVKIQPQRTAKRNNTESSTTPTPTAPSGPQTPITAHKYTIAADTDTRDNSPMWVVKITGRLNRDEYLQVAEQFKSIQGYYSKYKSGFIFRYDPAEVLQGAAPIAQREESTANTPAAEIAQPSTNQAQAEKATLLERINKSITSLQSKIDDLSGDYKTNTHKRMQEQSERERKKDNLQLEADILEHVKGKLVDNQPITPLEKNLTTGTFRSEMHYYYSQTVGAATNKHALPIKYPALSATWTKDDWRRADTQKRITRLQGANINNTSELMAAIDEYAALVGNLARHVNPAQQKIKRLANEYKLQQKGDINFTPAQVAAEMVKLSRIDHNSRVLEPSAGIGSIADEIRKVTTHIDVCERMAGFTELLALKGFTVVDSDCLEYNRQGYYDAVIMNPPFSNNQDILHLQHAYTLLKPGGILVCITSPHWTFASDRVSREFRAWLEEQNHETKELPSGTFEMTGVRSQIVVIHKHAETMQKAI